MKSSSLKLIDAGIPDPRAYRDALIHEWSLEERYRGKLFLFLQKETIPSELFFHMKDGELRVKGKLFSVTWLNSPERIRESKRVIVSLRYCKMLERGYALVKIMNEDGSTFDKLEY